VSELQTILDAYHRLRAGAGPLALATVVNSSGSVYRRPGARMLVTLGGETVGSVGAGCVERDVMSRAQRSMASGAPTVVRYDTTADADIVWGLGLGCRGIVEILIEPLDPAVPAEHLAFIAECLERNQVGVMATVFRAEGATCPPIGARVFHGPDGGPRGDVADSAIADVLMHDAGEARLGGWAGVREYRVGTSRVQALIELIRPRVSLVIFGADPASVPVARLAVQLGWRVTVADTRPGLVTAARFPGANLSVICPLEQAAERLSLHSGTAVIIMTQHYLWDLDLLRTLLLSPVRYLGLLGPRARTEALLAEIGPDAAACAKDRLFAPVGLDIGAETPEEIALAVIAEIQAAVAGRPAGFLRERPGPLHRWPARMPIEPES
jgi:xanthine/CO dehydrogenase XdhC/CoxF family maturation factor